MIEKLISRQIIYHRVAWNREGNALLKAHKPIAGPVVFAEETFGVVYDIYLELKMHWLLRKKKWLKNRRLHWQKSWRQWKRQIRQEPTPFVWQRLQLLKHSTKLSFS